MKHGNWLALILWTLIYSICCGKLCFEIFLSVYGRDEQYSRGRLKDLTEADKIYDNFLGVSSEGLRLKVHKRGLSVRLTSPNLQPTSGFLSLVQNLK